MKNRIMASINIYNISGEKIGRAQLPKEIFEAKINLQLMSQAVKVYLANQRKAQAKTKTRGEIVGSTRKIYRQKGTGRARHGDRYAPIFVGGGRAHGPKGILPRKLKLSKKMRRLALFSALTSKLKNKEIIIVQGLEKIEPKTKTMATIMKNLKCKMQNGKLKEKILLVLPRKIENLARAGRNMTNLQLAQSSTLNTYQVLKAGKLLLMKESLKVIKGTFL